MASSKALTDLQLRIMDVLWRRGQATVAEVRQALRPGRDLARNTVGTILSRMEKQGFVGHREELNSFVFYPLVSQQRVQDEAMKQMVDSLFGGSRTELVGRLLGVDKISNEQLDRIESLLRDYAARRKE